MARARSGTSSDPFIKLFGSTSRVRVLRLFLFNPKNSFTHADVASRTRVSSADVRRELAVLTQAGLLRRSNGKKQSRFSLDERFPYLVALQQMLLNAPLRGRDIYERLHRAGAIKLIVLSGIFSGDFDSTLDVLVVGDKLGERRLKSAMRTLDVDIGREIRYASLPTADFLYRLTVSDHFVRDVFDYPHRIVLDKLQIGLQ